MYHPASAQSSVIKRPFWWNLRQSPWTKWVFLLPINEISQFKWIYIKHTSQISNKTEINHHFKKTFKNNTILSYSCTGKPYASKTGTSVDSSHLEGASCWCSGSWSFKMNSGRSAFRNNIKYWVNTLPTQYDCIYFKYI